MGRQPLRGPSDGVLGDDVILGPAAPEDCGTELGELLVGGLLCGLDEPAEDDRRARTRWGRVRSSWVAIRPPCEKPSGITGRVSAETLGSDPLPDRPLRSAVATGSRLRASGGHHRGPGEAPSGQCDRRAERRPRQITRDGARSPSPARSCSVRSRTRAGAGLSPRPGELRDRASELPSTCSSSRGSVGRGRGHRTPKPPVHEHLLADREGELQEADRLELVSTGERAGVDGASGRRPRSAAVKCGLGGRVVAGDQDGRGRLADRAWRRALPRRWC